MGLVRRLSEPHFARLGVSGAQWGVLRALERLESRGICRPRMRELGDEILVQPPSLSATLDRMVRAGLVAREMDADDQRSRRVVLTSAGRSFLCEATESHLQWVEHITGALSRAQLSRLQGLLARMNDAMLRRADEPAAMAPARAPRNSARSGHNA